MARTRTPVLGSLALAFVALALAACSGDASSLERDTSDTEPTKPKAGRTGDGDAPSSSSTPPKAPSSSPAAPAAPAAPATPASKCAATADAVACVTCCVEDMPEIDEKTCTCDAASPCQAACGTNLCAGKIPNVACGQCLLANTAKIQSCLEAVVLAPKACVKAAGCLAKAGAENLDGLPLPFDLP